MPSKEQEFAAIFNRQAPEFDDAKIKANKKELEKEVALETKADSRKVLPANE